MSANTDRTQDDDVAVPDEPQIYLRVMADHFGITLKDAPRTGCMLAPIANHDLVVLRAAADRIDYLEGIYDSNMETLDEAIKELTKVRSDFDSAVRTLHDIAAMGRKAGSESAKHRLAQLGIGVPDYGSMT